MLLKILRRIILILIPVLAFSGHDLAVKSLPGQPSYIQSVYLKSGVANYLSYGIFETAIKGMDGINGISNKGIITIIDYSKQSSEERFFVVDVVNCKLLYKCLVAHGMETGEEKAEHFSNSPDSHMSCLGFFITGETYYGKNGYSLSLDGIEPGINDNARARAIVIHGASYVSPGFIEKYGRLGRSWGCPALPDNISKEIIDKIANGSCLFVYGNDPEYFKNSGFFNATGI